MIAQDGAFEIVVLKNGAHAVRHVGHGEVMHPSVGPWREAQALYVEQSRLRERLIEQGPPLQVWDVGLGAGTNAVAALSCARELGLRQRRALKITSFEIDLAPLRLALTDAAGFPFLQPFATAARALIETGRFEDELLSWELQLGDAAALWSERAFPAPELIFFDPFSPASNPALWTAAAFSAVHRHVVDSNCTLFTYSAATPTRVSLLLGGFFVGSGVSTGHKTETTVAATRLELLEQPLGARWLSRWERSSAKAPHGAGFDDRIERAVRAHPQFNCLGV